MKIAHIVKLLFAVSLSLFVISCSKSESSIEEEAPKSSAKQITSFVFLLSNNPIEVNVVGSIDEETKAITAQMPPNTDISALLPEIKISEKASIDIETVQNFSEQVAYTVTAEDGSKSTYTVTVTVQLSQRQILQAILDVNPDNLIDWDLETTTDLGSLTGVTTNSEGTIIELDIENSELSNLPPEIGLLFNLKVLNLQLNNIDTLPMELWSLITLEKLVLSENRITSLPAEIGQLLNLKTLSLSFNQLTTIPSEIGNLVQLASLDAAFNQLTSLPTEISQLTNLTQIYLSDNQFTDFPEEIGLLENLETLYLSSNQLTSVPTEIGNLTNLTTLGLGNNQLTSIPKEIGLLSNLTTLQLNDNPSLNTIPPEIGFLKNLTLLYYYKLNASTYIPQSICNLESNGLQIVDSPIPGFDYHTCETVSVKDALISIYTANPNNTLGWGPDNYPEVSFDENGNPTVINLNNANITTIPDNINFITTLETLNANSNNLEELSVSISELPNLTVMNFANNQLQTVPMEFGYMTDLALLNVTNNPITNIPSAVCDLRISTGDGVLTLLTDPGEGCD